MSEAKDREGTIRYGISTQKCERCGKEAGELFDGVCNPCISELIQADKAKRQPPRD